jgi:hypothetical protein
MKKIKVHQSQMLHGAEFRAQLIEDESRTFETREEVAFLKPTILDVFQARLG